MTISEMHIYFKLLMDKEDTSGLPNFQPEAIDMFINMAQRKFVKNRYSGSTTGLGFESIQKRTDDIRNVVESETLAPVSTATGLYTGKAVIYNLPLSEDYWFQVVTGVQNTYLDCDSTEVTDVITVQPTTRDRILFILNDPFNKPRTEYYFYSLMEGDTVLVFPETEANGIPTIGKGSGNNIMGNLYMDFIRKPADVNINTLTDSELAEHTHEEIVKESVHSALESIESQRYPVFNNELLKQE